MNYFFRLGIYFTLFLLSLLLVWFGLRSYAEEMPTSNYQTQLVKNIRLEPTPILWEEKSADNKKPLYLYINARFENNQWTTGLGNTKVPLTSLNEQKLAKYILLNIDFRLAKALPQLRNLLKQNNLWKKVILCSRSDGILNDLRKLEPEWTFCSGEIFMTRLLAFSSLKLQSLIQIRSDVLFIHLRNMSLNDSLLPIIKEAKRQNKLVFIGPVARPLDRFPADGWVVKK